MWTLDTERGTIEGVVKTDLEANDVAGAAVTTPERDLILFGARESREVFALDAERLTPLRSWGPFSHWPIALAVRPTDGLVAVGCHRGEIALLDPHGDLLARWSVDNADIWSVDFDPTGEHLAVSNGLGVIRRWSLAPLRTIGR